MLRPLKFPPPQPSLKCITARTDVRAKSVALAGVTLHCGEVHDGPTRKYGLSPAPKIRPIAASATVQSYQAGSSGSALGSEPLGKYAHQSSTSMSCVRMSEAPVDRASEA